MDGKIIRNWISTCHALTVIIFYNIGIPSSLLFYISMSYFILDSIYELSQLKGFKLFELGMLVHHAIAISSLFMLKESSPHTSMVYFFYYILELSNIPMYLVYHLKQVKYTSKLLVLFETFVYIYLRLYVCGTEIYHYFCTTEGELIIKFYMIIMLSLSIVWATKLIRQII
jgi:hypothetical protein